MSQHCNCQCITLAAVTSALCVYSIYAAAIIQVASTVSMKLTNNFIAFILCATLNFGAISLNLYISNVIFVPRCYSVQILNVSDDDKVLTVS